MELENLGVFALCGAANVVYAIGEALLVPWPNPRNPMARSLSIAAAALLLALSTGACGRGQQVTHNTYLGAQPPELTSRKEHWLGSEPPTLHQLRGKVVWLQFNF